MLPEIVLLFQVLRRKSDRAKMKVHYDLFPGSGMVGNEDAPQVYLIECCISHMLGSLLPFTELLLWEKIFSRQPIGVIHMEWA